MSPATPAVATGYDSLLDNKPALARTMAASVKQCIALEVPTGLGKAGLEGVWTN